MILVAGATGHVGGEACRLLLDRGQAVRVLVRRSSNPSRVADLRAAGAETVEADLRDPASLARACAGVDAVVSTATATGRPASGAMLAQVDGAGQTALVSAARAAGVQHFVFVSFSGGIGVDSPLLSAKRGMERALHHSGMTWTVLRPTFFMEVWLAPLLGFDVPNGSVTLYGSGGAPISFVSVKDVARFCADALRSEAARDATIELGGPDPITPLQAVRIAEELTDRTIEVTHVPLAALRAQYEASVDPLQKSFAALLLACAGGDIIDMRPTLRAFPGPLRSVRQFIQETYGRPVQARA